VCGLSLELVGTLTLQVSMYRYVWALTVALAGSAVMAQERNPLQSADCRKALDALETQEDAAAARSGSQTEERERRTVHAGLERARRLAAIACLGGRADSPPPSGRFAQPPITVAPITIAPAPRPPLPTGPVVTLPKKVEPPTTVTACDSAGCWASDGSRLQRVGPNLLGPRGLCIVQGPLLHCP
jgi:hypothetical protein